MKKKINIEKKIDFLKMISDITAISLEHDLHFVDSENIEGNLIVSGKYKSTVASQIEDDFSYKIPVDISLSNKIDQDNSKVDITDFSYELIDEKYLNCKIELLVNAVEMEDDRECDGDADEDKIIEIPKIEDNTREDKKEEEKNTNSEVEVSDESIVEDKTFFNIDSSKETYGKFIVYIVRQNETINSILEKYNTTLEEIEKYNNIKDLAIGTKLIIPILKKDD